MSSAITVTVIKEFTFDCLEHDSQGVSKEIAKLEKEGFRVLTPSSLSQLRPVREVVSQQSGAAKLVAEIIERTGCSGSSLAAAVGVHYATVLRWQKGVAHAKGKRLVRLHEAHKLATESPATFVRTARAALAAGGGREPAPAPVAAKPSPPTARNSGAWTRLSDSRKLEIAVAYEDGATYAELAEKHGVSVRRIAEVIREVSQ